VATTVSPARTRPAPGARTPVTAPTRRGVRLPELVLGVLLVFGFALGAVVWHTSTTARTDVTVLAHDVRRGDVVTAADLRAEPVAAGAAVRLVPWAHHATYVGQVAVVDMAAGSPLERSLVQDAAALGAGEGLASVKLSAGGAPQLAAGDRVDAVAIPQDNVAIPQDAGAAPEAVVVAAGAVVWSVEPVGDSETSEVVTLRLPLEDARRVSAAAGALRLVRVG
jgi:hypothetical protein